MSANSGYTFYKDLYTINTNGLKVDTTKVTNLLASMITAPATLANSDKFPLTTTYPGLVSGVGLNHGVKNDDDDFKIGFYFDHTTGQPILMGSSIKGVLRSVFPNLEKDPGLKALKTNWLQVLISHIDEEDTVFYTSTYQPDDSYGSFGSQNIEAIEVEIFDGKKNGEYVSIYNRDIFHDAVISSIALPILDSDYITPHFENVLKNPNPIKFLKILPNIEFTFQFDLKDGLIKKEQKLKLFKKILLTIGVGAKTNVGYGQFSLEAANPTIFTPVVANNNANNNRNNNQAPPLPVRDPREKREGEFDATWTRTDPKNQRIQYITVNITETETIELTYPYPPDTNFTDGSKWIYATVSRRHGVYKIDKLRFVAKQ